MGRKFLCCPELRLDAALISRGIRTAVRGSSVWRLPGGEARTLDASRSARSIEHSRAATRTISEIPWPPYTVMNDQAKAALTFSVCPFTPSLKARFCILRRGRIWY